MCAAVPLIFLLLLYHRARSSRFSAYKAITAEAYNSWPWRAPQDNSIKKFAFHFSRPRSCKIEYIYGEFILGRTQIFCDRAHWRSSTCILTVSQKYNTPVRSPQASGIRSLCNKKFNSFYFSQTSQYIFGRVTQKLYRRRKRAFVLL